ncbi:hypothetical protein BDZ89DRAFT_1061913 [Hymenopellis radicata]|nr:hypothetical protein BDZ89DRAFT_1061913 [Hymenopellis radicata]
MYWKKREILRQKVKESNKTLTYEAMKAASPLEAIPRCYFPDPDLNHFPPLWFLGILVTFDDIWNFGQIHNLVPPCTTPSEKDSLHAEYIVEKYLGETFQFTPRYKTKIEFVHDKTKTSHYCVSLCSNYTFHLWPEDTLAEMEDRLLKLWDFIKPTMAWYLDAAASPSAQRGERTEWPLDFDLVWGTKYAVKYRSSPSIVPA